jgi:hypothetical protein
VDVRMSESAIRASEKVSDLLKVRGFHLLEPISWVEVTNERT